MRRVSAILVALVLSVSLSPPARGATSSDPFGELVAARGTLTALAGQARPGAARQAVLGAEAQLQRATAPFLWPDPGHLVAPSPGLSVFSHCRGALAALEHAPSGSLPPAAVSGVEAQILAADRRLAVGEIVEALGGSPGLLARAQGMILSGDRWAQTSRLDLAAEQYGAGWLAAFQALAELVHLRVASVSGAALGAGARGALAAGSAMRPAGVRVVRGHAQLLRAGRPEVLFVGAESCPSCAIERWGVAVALSRFGIFSSLPLGQSAVGERPFVRGFTFLGSRYFSPYVSFLAVELTSDAPAPGGGFAALDRLTPGQRRLMRSLDPKGFVPFIDVANRFADVGATVSPAPAQGLSWPALAASLSRPGTPSGQAIAASAEVLTAEICRATGGMPASVCGGAVVQEYASRLAGSGGAASGCAVGAARRPGVRSGRRGAVSATAP